MTLEMAWHPLDDADFREWLRTDCEYDTDNFAYGIYDQQWLELYEMYQEEIENA